MISRKNEIDLGPIRIRFHVNFYQRFPNAPCGGSTSKNGTCYTTEECSSKGGTNEGSCASGYGVCCTCKFEKPHFFHRISRNFFFQLLQDADQRLPKIAPISNPLELKVEHVG